MNAKGFYQEMVEEEMDSNKVVAVSTIPTYEFYITDNGKNTHYLNVIITHTDGKKGYDVEKYTSMKKLSEELYGRRNSGTKFIQVHKVDMDETVIGNHEWIMIRNGWIN